VSWLEYIPLGDVMETGPNAKGLMVWIVVLADLIYRYPVTHIREWLLFREIKRSIRRHGGTI